MPETPVARTNSRRGIWRSRVGKHGPRLALPLLLLLPVFLLHGRAGAEILIALIDLLFLASIAVSRDWRCLRSIWLWIGLAWWLWLVGCSLPVGDLGAGGWASEAQALATLRFLIFVAALEWFVLVRSRFRRLLQAVMAASACYIAAQTLLQFVTGHNLYGDPRSGDGELTGPFDKPRAAAPLSRLLFPALLPPLAWLLARGRPARAAAALLTVLSVGVVVLIGQRMPLLLTGLGLAVTGLFLRRLRLILLAAVIAGGALVAASAVVSPPTFYRLVTKFSRQMDDFKDSPYGRIYLRSWAIAEANPWTGRGFDGFRTGCADPRYFIGWNGPGEPGGDGGGAGICVQHPHNHYLQAVTDAGLPGLALFSLLVFAWLVTLARGLWRDPDPLRVGLFVAALIQEWPIASTSSVTSMPMSGWFFLLLGWGLAEARWRPAPAPPISTVPTRQTESFNG